MQIKVGNLPGGSHSKDELTRIHGVNKERIEGTWRVGMVGRENYKVRPGGRASAQQTNVVVLTHGMQTPFVFDVTNYGKCNQHGDGLGGLE